MIVWQNKESKEKIDALCRLVPRKKFELLTLDCLCRENDGTFSRAETETGRLPDRSFRSFFMYYEGKRLVGELYVFPLTDNSAEITAIVDPCRRRSGIFTKLYDLAKEEMEKYGIADWFFVAEPDCRDAREVLGHMNLSAVRSEYIMEAGYIDLKSFDEADSKVTLLFEEGDGTVTALLTATGASERENMLIGQAKAVGSGNEAFIFEVEIEKDHRGRGYGGRIISGLIKHLEESAPGMKYRLQVSSDNKAACGLYRKLGFRVAKQLDYFTVDKNKKP